MTTSFSLTWDYRCPFARNVAEHVLAGLGAGAGWEITWVPFSLNQAHVEEGGVDVWDDPGAASALVAMRAGLAVRDGQPQHFAAVHGALFGLRHDRGGDLRNADAVYSAVAAAGADAGAARNLAESDEILDTFRKEHESGVAEHSVWGVPTFVSPAGAAVFVRLMTRPDPADPGASIAVVERVLGLLDGFPELNEFKHTSISR